MAIRRWISLVACLAFVAAAIGLFYTAYRRANTPLQLMNGTVMVDGNVTEKLIQRQPATPLPFEVPVYVVRYAYPSPQGQMRTGEQIVTRGFYEQLGGQGAPVTVTMREDDPGISAVEARLTFAGPASWRLMLAGLCLLVAYLALVFGVISGNRRPAVT